MRGIFVIGTDTGIGKTIISAALASALKKRGVDVAVMKPFATGQERFSKRYRSEDASILAEAAKSDEGDDELNPFFLSLPASPLMAAEILQLSPPNLQVARASLEKLAAKHQFLIVEGIGGLMVPINEREYLADFAKLIGLPVIVVTHPRLGTLNHTLLTVRVCRDYGLNVLGIIVNMMPQRPTIVEENTPTMLQKLASIPILAVVPESKAVDYGKIGEFLEKEKTVEKIIS